MFSKTKLDHIDSLRKLVNVEITQRLKMLERHKEEKCELQKQQAAKLQIILMNLMENVQATQMMQLEVRYKMYLFSIYIYSFLNFHFNF